MNFLSNAEQKRAFTIIELLIASTIFIGLMSLLSVAFNRLSSGGQKSLEVMQLHAKADALMRFMEQEVRCMPHIAAIHLKQATGTEPGTLTFMKQTSNTHYWRSHYGRTSDDINPYNKSLQRFRFTDIIWTRWQWGDGAFKAGESRMNNFKHRIHFLANHKNIQRFNTASLNVLQLVNLDQAYGMQDNDVEPMVQRHYDFFEGKGSPAPVNATTGACAASAGDKIRVYKTVGGDYRKGGHLNRYWLSETIEGTAGTGGKDAPYRLRNSEYQGGDYRHHYTTLSVGNNEALSDSNAYAVRNEDGQSLNKDRLNLIGADDTDANDRALYPSQIKEIISGVEFYKVDMIKRNGDIIGAGDETDRLGDGGTSLDISGIEPESGVGRDKRPIQMRMYFLLHAIPDEEFDELDFDEDGDVSERLSKSMRDAVYADTTLTTNDERLQAFKKLVIKAGYVAIEFNQSVQLGY